LAGSLLRGSARFVGAQFQAARFRFGTVGGGIALSSVEVKPFLALMPRLQFVEVNANGAGSLFSVPTRK